MASAMRNARLARLAVVTAILTVVGAAVAGSTLAGTGARSADKELLIGENTIRSGPAAGSYLISEGFQCYLDYINKNGGVNGYTFNIDTRDNQYNAAQSALAQTQLLAKNPFAISVIGTLPVVSAAEVTKSQGSRIPLMVAADGALVQDLSGSMSGGIYGIVPNYNFLGPFDAQFIMTKLKEKQFALAFENSALAQNASKAISAYVKRKGGKLLRSLPVEPTTTDFVPLATQLKNTGAKTVLVWTNLGLLASLQKAADQIGYKPKWVTPFFSFSSAYLRLAGPLAEGTYVDAILPTRGPAVQRFVRHMRTCAPRAINGAGEQGWQLAAAMVEGIRGATANGRTLTQPSFLAAMKRINKVVELAALDYRKKNWGVSRAAMYQVKGGRFVQVQGFSPLPGT